MLMDSQHSDSTSALDPRLPPDREPPLSISHILVWTALSGALMCWMNWEAKLEGQALPTSAPLQLGTRAFWAMSGGASLGGVLLLLRRRMRRSVSRPMAPGEWLWFTQGACMLLSVAAGSVFIPLFMNPRSATYVLAAYYGMTYLSATLIFLLPAVRCNHGGPWKFLFWTASVLEALSAVLFAWMIIATPTGLSPRSWSVANLARQTILAAALIWALASDRRQGAKRPWTHWVGAMIMAVNLAMQFSSSAWTLYNISA